MLIAVAIAFVPAALVGVILESEIKDVLFGVGPVIGAWFVGGILILVLTRAGVLAPRGGRVLEMLTPRDALVIGLAQVISLWPGTSRSLVTIVAALLLGYSMAAAVEFSFLLGFVTLGAATAYQVLKDGQLMIDAFGWFTPLVGLVAAFLGRGRFHQVDGRVPAAPRSLGVRVVPHRDRGAGHDSGRDGNHLGRSTRFP